MPQTASAAGLRYASSADLNSVLEQCRGHVLGIVGFGSPCSEFKGIASTWVDMPTIDSGPVFEVWTSALPVQTKIHGSIRGAHNSQVLFGCVEIPQDDRTDYDVLIYTAYCEIFDYLDALGYPNLIRIWHYLPDIHFDEHSLERYRRFSLGRHEAFIAKRRTIVKDVPAASAVGKHSANTVIYFLATPLPGIPIENPRQVSAYSYPAQYGPRGPTFCRALFTSWNDLPQLYISGTAAIFGHQSQHAGDAKAQTDETIVNLRSVMDEADVLGLIDVRRETDLLFKVYLRQPALRTIAEARLRETFGPAPSIVYLQAEICRRELLLEIEVVCTRRSRLL